MYMNEKCQTVLAGNACVNYNVSGLWIPMQLQRHNRQTRSYQIRLPTRRRWQSNSCSHFEQVAFCKQKFLEKKFTAIYEPGITFSTFVHFSSQLQPLISVYALTLWTCVQECHLLVTHSFVCPCPSFLSLHPRYSTHHPHTAFSSRNLRDVMDLKCMDCRHRIYQRGVLFALLESGANILDILFLAVWYGNPFGIKRY